MIVNIVDGRKRKYRFMKINAVVEAAWHDNRCKDVDHVRKNIADDGPAYAELEHITLAEALAWGNSFVNSVTLYIYDEDGGIYAREEGRAIKSRRT